MARSLDELLAAAAATIDRLQPPEAWAAVEAGAVLVDTRSTDARRLYGVVPGSLHVPRTVLEWRLQPGGPWRNAYAPDVGDPVLVLCDAGLSSVFAAAQLVELGYTRAGDVIGGFAAWRRAGLPWHPGTDPPQTRDEVPGMRPPE